MGKAYSGMCVGVGKISKIKAARPTGANLLPSPPHDIERVGRAKGDGTQLPHLLFGTG
jgi:hypothetical protein